MRTRGIILALLVGLTLGVAPALWAVSDKADADEIARLVAQLGSKKFSERAKATKALEAIGKPALDALRKAVNSSDMETSHRAKDLVAKIEKRLEAETLLAPTRVRLVCKDMPVIDAVAELAKKSKYDVQIEPNSRAKLAKRTVTLDTGEVSFWEALDKLCQKANLVESTLQIGGVPIGAPQPLPRLRIQPAVPLPANPPVQIRPAKPVRLQAAPVAPNGQVQVGQIQVNGGGPIQIQVPVQGGLPAQVLPVMPPNGGLGGLRPIQFQQPGQILLADGKPETLPTCYSGAFRIRLKIDPAAKGKDTLSVQLEVSAEPKLQNWSVAGNPKIEEAGDDQGQKLTLVLEKQPANPAVGGAAAGGGIVGRNVAMPAIARWAGPGTGYKHTVLVQLKLGEKQAKVLKQLKGSLTVDAHTAPEPLITVDNILKAAGKTTKGAKGGSLKVLAIQKDNNGNYQVRFELEQPEGAVGGVNPFGRFAGGGVIQMQQIQIQIQGNGRVIRQVVGLPNTTGISLVDAKSNAYQVVGVSGRFGNGAAEHTLTFRAGNGTGEPAKLVYTGQRKVSVDVPFTFKDVKLSK